MGLAHHGRLGVEMLGRAGRARGLQDTADLQRRRFDIVDASHLPDPQAFVQLLSRRIAARRRDIAARRDGLPERLHDQGQPRV